LTSVEAGTSWNSAWPPCLATPCGSTPFSHIWVQPPRQCSQKLQPS